jgi:diketogulonate reductase-like aldo/keto reductase
MCIVGCKIGKDLPEGGIFEVFVSRLAFLPVALSRYCTNSSGITNCVIEGLSAAKHEKDCKYPHSAQVSYSPLSNETKALRKDPEYAKKVLKIVCPPDLEGQVQDYTNCVVGKIKKSETLDAGNVILNYTVQDGVATLVECKDELRAVVEGNLSLLSPELNLMPLAMQVGGAVKSLLDSAADDGNFSS